jgi:hypothetical protein
MDRFSIDKWGSRHFALYDGEELVCVTVYKKGAQEVKRRLTEYENALSGGADGKVCEQGETWILPNAADSR